MNRHPPRTDQPQNVEEIVDKVEQLLKIRPGSTIFLNPDCGFGTFAPRPMNTADQAFKKLETMVAAAKQLRQLHG